MFPVVAPTLLLRKRMGHPHPFLIDAERVGHPAEAGAEYAEAGISDQHPALRFAARVVERGTRRGLCPGRDRRA